MSDSLDGVGLNVLGVGFSVGGVGHVVEERGCAIDGGAKGMEIEARSS